MYFCTTPGILAIHKCGSEHVDLSLKLLVFSSCDQDPKGGSSLVKKAVAWELAPQADGDRWDELLHQCTVSDSHGKKGVTQPAAVSPVRHRKTEHLSVRCAVPRSRMVPHPCPVRPRLARAKRGFRSSRADHKLSCRSSKRISSTAGQRCGASAQTWSSDVEHSSNSSGGTPNPGRPPLQLPPAPGAVRLVTQTEIGILTGFFRCFGRQVLRSLLRLLDP